MMLETVKMPPLLPTRETRIKTKSPRPTCGRTGTNQSALEIGRPCQGKRLRPPSLYQADQNRDNRDHQQNVDESTERVGTHQSEEPEHHQDDGQRCKKVHNGPYILTLILFTTSFTPSTVFAISPARLF